DLDLDLAERAHGGAVEHRAVAVEPGAVAGAVPALLGAVPLHRAAQVGAVDRHGVDGAVRCPVGPHGLPAGLDDATFAGGEVVERAGAEASDAVPDEVGA